jgi:hypothetical protein
MPLADLAAGTVTYSLLSVAQSQSGDHQSRDINRGTPYVYRAGFSTPFLFPQMVEQQVYKKLIARYLQLVLPPDVGKPRAQFQ